MDRLVSRAFWHRRKLAGKLKQLREILIENLVRSEFPVDSCREYLPAGCRSKLVTQETIHSLLKLSPGLAEYVSRDATTLFLVLVAASRALEKNEDKFVKILQSCKDSKMTDQLLPIMIKELGCVGNAGAVSCTHHSALDVFHGTTWSTSLVDDFYTYQPKFYPPPVFGSERFRYKVPIVSVLPFEVENGGNMKPKRGHFSDVYSVILHQSHHDPSLGNIVPTAVENGLRVAIKQLKLVLPDQEYNIEQAWENEISALEELNKFAHPHLIKSMAAIEYGSHRLMMLEWADGGSLREIWNKEDGGAKRLDATRIQCVLDELHGLAGALSMLHETKTKTIPPKRLSNALPVARQHQGVPSLELPVDNSGETDNHGGMEHWRHGDLKPDNILSVKDPKGERWLGTLKIADFGLIKRHEFETDRRFAQTQQTYTTLQYEGPETLVNSHLPRSRKFDIWSMGCVILEFAIFLLYGKHGLGLFGSEQHRASFNKSTETLYFTVHNGVAEVSSIAKHWINQILQHPECQDRDSAIRDLVELVQNDLLVVNVYDKTKKSRATAKQLEESLKGFKEKAAKTSGYLCGAPSQATAETPTVSPEIFSPKPTKKAVRVPGRMGKTLGEDLRLIAENLVLSPPINALLKATADGFQEVRTCVEQHPDFEERLEADG
ncbi:kinase-like domain-containing protein [Cercophora samala]|uniref:Kinase-like domain-containing protein n=1 Tax=Cercophora samala TaxID=330535 RepID=A0AA39ZDS3_9PEZI|nr:kinase-like domain-containing protein [Cercophora samala]